MPKLNKIKINNVSTITIIVLCIGIVIGLIILCKVYVSPFVTVTKSLPVQTSIPSATVLSPSVSPEVTESSPPTESQYAIPQSVNPPEMQKPQGCPNSNDTESICNNYESCCNNIPTTECYCKNPSVSLCKGQYDQCMANNNIIDLYTQEQRKQMCSDQRGLCCALYNSLAGINRQYPATAGVDQKVDQICLLGLQQDVTTKCPALCSTNKNCAAYSAGNATCKLFSSANPIMPVNVFNKSGTENGITYYKKQ
jgi:hypothetical protein